MLPCTLSLVDLWSQGSSTCVVEMLSWLTRRNEVTVGVPALVVAGHRRLRQHLKGSHHTWDFDDDSSQTAAACVTSAHSYDRPERLSENVVFIIC